jgi:hypothetical protein
LSQPDQHSDARGVHTPFTGGPRKSGCGW